MLRALPVVIFGATTLVWCVILFLILMTTTTSLQSLRSIECLDEPTQAEFLAYLVRIKSSLRADPSNYAKGRLSVWLGIEWSLLQKTFVDSRFYDYKIHQICERVYPNFQMALITYSGDPDGEKPAGIGLHRDDSYAAFAARTLSLNSNSHETTRWQYRQCYPGIGYCPDQDDQAEIQDLILPSGEIIEFNCKNPHAAYPEFGRWSINCWKISGKMRDSYNQFLKNLH